MTIYFVRHGETLWNRIGRFQGRADSPLTLRGIHLAIAYGNWLRAELEGIAGLEIHTSPLGRAVQTATILADCIGLPPERIQPEPRLAEADVGKLTGYTWPEVEQQFGIVKGQVGGWHFRPPDGESGSEQFARAESWLADAVRKPCIVVSHGGFSRFFRAAYLRLAPEDIEDLESHTHGRLFMLRTGAVNAVTIDQAEALDSPLLARE